MVCAALAVAFLMATIHGGEYQLWHKYRMNMK
jgi:hypothetical protein